MTTKKAAKGKGAKSKKAAKKMRPHAPAVAAPVNEMRDRRGTAFDPALHAATPEGTPHADSAGNFINKADHYDGAKKAHYGDTFRHA